MNKKYLLSLLTIVMVTFLSVGFSSCGDDDDNGTSSGEGNSYSALVGTWTRKLDSRGMIGIKLTADGKAYFNEWDYKNKGEEPDFSNVGVPANWKATASTVRFTHSQEPDFFEEYSYILSEDGKSLTLNLIDKGKGGTHAGSGTFTKYSK